MTDSYQYVEDSPLEARYSVYFSGVQVPATFVTITNASWEMPQASIGLPASPLLHRFGHDDRVQVAVFYKDVFNARTISDAEFRLIFDGEVTSYSHAKSAVNHEMQFAAVSHVQLFAELFIDFLTDQNELVSSYMGTGGDSGIAIHGPLFPTLLFAKGLDFRGGLIRRPVDLIRNVLGTLANNGVLDNAGKRFFIRSTPVEKFFNKHRRLIKLAKRFAACPVVEDRLADGDTAMFPVVAAIRHDQMLRALSMRAMGFSNRSSVWQLFYVIFQMMFYDILFLNAPPFVLSDHAFNIIGKGSTDLPRTTDDHLFKRVSDDVAGVDIQVGSESVRLQLDKGYDEYLKTIEGSRAGDITWEESSLTLPHPTLAQYITKPANFFGIPPRCNVVFPSMVRALSYMENYATQPTRLYTGDVEWIMTGSPSATNMLDIADAALRSGYPDIINVRFKAMRGGETTASAYDFMIWPEEYFKGVIMTKEVAPNWLRILAQDLDSIKAKTTKDTSDQEVAAADDGDPSQPEGGLNDSSGNYNDKIIRTMAAYAKYRFFQEKYSRRNGTINMEFNPYIIPGLPMLYLDGQDTAEHFLAYVTNVTWNMSVGNMSTQVSYAMARSVYENESLLRKKFIEISPDLSKGYASLTAPDDPIHTLVPILNQYKEANNMFQRLLWPGETDTEDFFTGAYQDFLEREVLGGTNQPLTTDGTTVPTAQFVLRIRPEYQHLSNNYKVAMQFIARPICTLAEYIYFINGVDLNDGNSIAVVDEDPKNYLFIKHYTAIDPQAILDTAEEVSDTGDVLTIEKCIENVVDADVRLDYELLLLRYVEQVYSRTQLNTSIQQ